MRSDICYRVEQKRTAPPKKGNPHSRRRALQAMYLVAVNFKSERIYPHNGVKRLAARLCTFFPKRFL